MHAADSGRILLLVRNLGDRMRERRVTLQITGPLFFFRLLSGQGHIVADWLLELDRHMSHTPFPHSFTVNVFRVVTNQIA
jgi:hypothetical protein